MVALLACWLLLGAPAAATTAADTLPTEPAHVEATADTEPAAPTDGGGGDPALAPTLVAIVLLVVTIGLHALYRDPR